MTEREDTPDLFAAPIDPASSAQPAAEPMSRPVAATAVATTIGGRLREARQAKGLGVAECADRLHLPIKVLERLEADDFGEPGHFVFLRGALRGYARFLDMPPGSCDNALRAAEPIEQPALVSVARTSPTRWLLQRYGTAATYIVLTATIAVPLVLLGLRGGLDRPPTRIVSLDQAPLAAQQHPTQTKAPVVVEPATLSPDATPFRASMTPFAAIGLSDVGDGTQAVPVSPAPVPAAVAGQHTLVVSANADCWFEITDDSGAKVDSGMLHAGESRTWHSASVLNVTLGNADGVTVTSDGQPLPLDAYRHANVARFDVFGGKPGSGENG